jgi:hypothetical protein
LLVYFEKKNETESRSQFAAADSAKETRPQAEYQHPTKVAWRTHLDASV